jgi:hypothetical protein
MTLKVSSTTDTEEEVRQSVGLPAEKTDEEKAAEEARTKAPEGLEADARTEESDKEKEKDKGGWTKRLEKVTTNLHQTKQELQNERTERAKLEARLAKLEGGNSERSESGRADSDPRPVRANFASDAEFNEAQTRWASRDETKKEGQRKELEAANERSKALFKSYTDAVPAAMTAHEDYVEVLSADPKIPIAVQTAIISMGDEGPEAAYTLAKDPETCARLVEIMEEKGDAAAVVAFGRYVAKAVPEKTETEEQKAARVAAAAANGAPPVRPGTRAPAPITPINGSRTAPKKDLSEIVLAKGKNSLADLRRIRERGQVN